MAKRPDKPERDHIQDDLEEVTAGDPRTAKLAREVEDAIRATSGEASSN